MRTRSPELGPEAWPIAVPEDADDPAIVKASGVVTLPLHVRWSGPPKTYDLSIAAERARVYEQVLREGTIEDVRVFIDVDELFDLWNDLVLPVPVRRVWAAWFRKHRGIDLAC